MVAIVSGNSLGLSLTSPAGNQGGLVGSSALGRTGQQVYVNSANGNLVLQNSDDHLASTGFDVFSVRTYNSQGAVDGDGNADNWRIGFFRGIDSLTGTLNTTGSTITRTDADGARAIYRHNGTTYINTDGAGAHDTMSYDAAGKRWLWTDGSTRSTETYDWNGASGKLTRQADGAGNGVDFMYTGDQLAEVRTQSGEKQMLVYAGKNLAEVRTVKQNGDLVTRVRYGYDDQDRLAMVTVDLTPEDNSIADGKTYVTAYSYHGDSKRVAGILESDGTQAMFAYRQQGASWLVESLTQVVDGVARKTTFDYDNDQTRITDALGNTTIVTSDATGRLTRVSAPDVAGARQSATYTYNGAGDLLTQTDALGNTLSYEYDSQGNQISATDRLGHLVRRTFNGANQVVTEAASIGVPVYSWSMGPSRTTRYVYDSCNRLRFTISEERRVTEYRYDAAGNQSAVIAYSAQTYSATVYTDTDLAKWLNGIPDKSTVQRTDYAYDFRGQACTVTAWASIGANGEGIADGSQSVTRMVYDQSGQLLQTIYASGLIETKSYDGLGRVLSSTDNAGAATMSVYDDTGRRVLTTQSGGLATTSVYNAAGELISVLRSDGSGALGETRYWYDAGGRLRLVQDPDGAKRALVYDAAGKQVAGIDATGRLTEYKYNLNGKRTQSITYATAVPLASLASTLDLTQATNAAHLQDALGLTLESIRPVRTPTDERTWNLYDAGDRLVWQIDALGFATQTLYDGQSRAYATNRLATPLDVSRLGDGSDVLLKLQGSASAVELSESGSASGPNGARTYIAVIRAADSYPPPSGTVTFFAGSRLLGSSVVVSGVATITVANLPVGHSDITAVYSGDATNTGSTSRVLGAEVAPAQATSVTLALDKSQVAVGEALSLTATVSGAEPSGMVAFCSGDIAVGYAVVKNGVATLAIDSLSAGLQRLTASYLGDTVHAASNSAGAPAIVLVTGSAPASIALSSSDALPAYGMPLVLRAELVGLAPAGTVVFFSGEGKQIGEAAIVDGIASISVASLAAGKNTITAMYLGDGVNPLSVGTLVQEVAPASTSVMLSFPPGPSAQGAPLVLNATVSRPGAGYAGGSVTVYQGATVIGRADLYNGQAAITVNNLLVGANDLSVRYGGDADNRASRTDSALQLTVAAPQATALDISASRRELAAGDKLVLTANVATRSGLSPTGIVTFFNSREVLGTAPVIDGVATLEVAYHNAGALGSSYPMAAYSGDAAHTASTVTLGSSVYVLKGAPPPVPSAPRPTLVFEAGPTAVMYGEATVLRVAVAGPDADHPPTGAVIFFDGKAIIGSAPVVDGVATLQFAALTAASQSITAVYSGDQYNASTPNVGGPTRTITMTARTITPVLNVSRTASGSLRLSATIDYPNSVLAGLLDGSASMVFYAGDKVIDTVTVINGRAVLDNIDTASVANGEFKAVYRSDSGKLRAAGASSVVSFSPPAEPVRLTLQTFTTYTATGPTLDVFANTSRYVMGGTFSLFDGDVLVSRVNASPYSSSARFTVTSVPNAVHQYRVEYSGDPARKIAPSYSMPFVYNNFGPAPMKITQVPVDAQGIEVPWSSPAVQYAKFTVTVQGVQPGGTVVLYRSESNIRLDSAELVNGEAVFMIPASELRADWQTYTAVYSGDARNGASKATLDDYLVSGPSLAGGWSDSMVLSSAPVPNGDTGLVQLVATVTSADPKGMVTFKDAYGNVLGVSALMSGRASLTVPVPAGGLAAVKAIFRGGLFDNETTAAYTEPRLLPGVGTVALSASDNMLPAGAPVLLTARVGGTASGGSVTFFDGVTRLGTVQLQNGVAELITSALTVGINHLTAVYSGGTGTAGSVSAAVDATVLGVPVNVTLKTSADTIRQGGAVTYTATVTGKVPGGVVTFVSGLRVLGTATVQNGVATLQLARNAFDVGTATVVASYAGDAENAPAVSAGVHQSVTAGTRQLVVGNDLADRWVWSYTDGDGNVRATVDADNFLTEYVYDAANRLVKSIAYARPVDDWVMHGYERSSSRGAFGDIAPWLPTASATDRTTYYFYDKLGRKVGDVNAEGYLSEYIYDSAGRVVETVRYANPARAPVGVGSTVASLRPAGHAEDRRTSKVWDIRNRLTSETAADGTVTTYQYDNEDRLIRTTRAQGTQDAQSTLKRYDAQGRLKATLDAVGTALIGGDQSASEVDAIWTNHGTSYAYDLVGKLISTTTPQGQRTIFFHDDDGRLRYTVNALGEVSENQYDSLGRLSAVTRYAGRVTPLALNAMAGGALSANPAAAQALLEAGNVDASHNSVMRMDYDLAGHVVKQTDALGGVSSMTYNAFGEVVATTRPGTMGAGNVTTVRSFDHRGYEIGSVTRSDKVYISATAQVDAFGQVIRSVDAGGNVRKSAFDRLGRVIQVTDPAGATRSSSYDAFGRQLSAVDASGNVTRYRYNTAARSTTVTTAEGVTSTTVITRNGQIRSIVDGAGNTTSYHYDQNGNLLDVATPDGVAMRVYDAANRLVRTTDNGGREVEYTYDAANRLLTRTVEWDGKQLRTRYDYDAKGQAVRTTDATGVVTLIEFDLNGQAISQTLDANGARLTTTYTHDVRGQVVSVRQPGGARTDYVYDDLGRRIQTVSDPTGLKLVERYEYDNNGNVTARVDASGGRTRYAYDSLDRLVYTVDPTGYVTENIYDVKGQLTRNTVYARAVSLSKLGATPSRATIAYALSQTTAQDLVRYRVHDKDGRVAFDIDALGGVTAYQYDANGNVKSSLTYANRIDMAAWKPGSAPAPVADSSRDVLLRTVYDAMNRPVYGIDGLGHVVEMRYGADGNMSEKISYARPIPVTTATSGAAVAAALVPDPAHDERDRYVYDYANRVILHADTLGKVEGFDYDQYGNVIKAVDYATPLAAGTGLDSIAASAGDHVTLMAYDAGHRLALRIDATGQISRRTYDGNGNLIRTVEYAVRIPRPSAASPRLDADTIAALAMPDVRDRVSLSVFDGDNREIYSIDATGAVIARQFDAADNVVSRTAYFNTVALPATADAASMAALVAGIADATRDDQMRFVYDAAGRALWRVNAAGDAIAYTYTASGQVTSMTTYLRRIGAGVPMTTAALAGAVTGATVHDRHDYVYDAANQLTYEIDGSNTVTSYQYDNQGREIMRTVHAQRIVRSGFVPGTAPKVVADPVRDSTVRTMRDSAGRPIFTVDRDGFVLALKYDGQGNVAERIAYANRIDPQTATSAAAIAAALRPDARGDARSAYEYDQARRLIWQSDKAGQVTGITYDAAGRVIKQIAYATPVAAGVAPHSVVASAADRVVLTAYDRDGHVVLDVDPTGRVSTTRYDANGRAVERRTYVERAAVPTALSAPIDARFVLPPPDAVHDRVARIVYDNVGREIFSIDQAGAVTATRYDGKAVEHIAYVNGVPAETTATPAALTAALRADGARDRFERSVTDADGRVTSAVDARGNVTRYSYDAQGNVIETISPEGDVARKTYDGHGRVTYSVDELGGVTGYTYDAYGNVIKQIQFATALAAGADPALLSSSPKVDDRVSLMAYDQHGQLLYAVDPEGTVRRQHFDAAGNMTQLTIYAGKLNTTTVAAGAWGVGTLDAMIVPQPAADRTSRQVFDATNRMVHSVDPMGYVQKYTYDARGNLTSQTRYATSIFTGSAFSDYTVAGLDARVVVDGHDAIEQFRHNAMGQVVWHQDATGNTESTRYDSVGQKIGFTDTGGGEWTYRYDAAGNQIEETAPEVAGSIGGNYRRVVRSEYDALRQLLKRTEIGDGQQIVHSFTFDNMGNQVRIGFGTRTVYLPGVAAPQTDGEVTTSKAYNRRGQVIMTVDADGYVSHNVYDALGRLCFEIDAKGNATGHGRNIFGDETSLVRYDGVVSIGPAMPPTLSQVTQSVAALDPKLRREITYTYDRAGRVLQVTEPVAYCTDFYVLGFFYEIGGAAARVSRNTYDAFGGVILHSSLSNHRTMIWQTVNSYYDQRGQISAQVDAAGYLTSYRYDSAGNLSGKIESAVAIAGWTGNRATPAVAVADARDRITSTQYDGQNRVIRESLTDGSGKPQNEHVRVTEYDAMGNVTSTRGWGPGSTGSDAPNRIFHDALGRVTAIIDGTHPVGAGFGLTTYRYNLAGKLASETAWANGSAGPDSPAPAMPSAEDRTRTVRYDQQGNAIHIVNAEGVSQYLSYNNRGLLTSSWYVGNGGAYALGEVFGLATRGYDELGRMVSDTGQALTLQYNAFGELVRKQQETQVITWDYDNAGRMWRTNESGAEQIIRHDVLGRKVGIITADGNAERYEDLRVLANASVPFNLFPRLIRYGYDAAGHVTEIDESRSAYFYGGRSVTTQVSDRWGNLLSKTEPAASGLMDPTISYTYDVQNRVTSERYAQADGSGGGRVREFQYGYGAQGAMVSRVTVDRESAAVTGPESNDAGHARYRVTSESYTAAGKLLSAVTNGILVERHSYDAFDQLRTDEMEVGRTVRYDYDRTGHVTSVTHAPVDVYRVGQGTAALALIAEGRKALVERYAYDELGHLMAYTNGAGEISRFKHDVHGHRTWTDTPGSAPTSATWDAAGRQLSATDAYGNKASWTYDSYGRLQSMTGYDGSVTTYGYDQAGQLRSARQPAKGQVVSYTYDYAGQLISIVDTTTAVNGYLAITRETTYDYDLAGNRVRERTRQGGKLFADNRQTYDALHRLVSVNMADIGQGAQTISYQYDGFGNRSRFVSQAPGKGTDRNQTGYFLYDALNRMVVSGALDAQGTVGAQTQRYVYDSAGNLANTVVGGRNTQFGYDAMNRVISTSINGVLAFTTSYDAAGRVVADAVASDDAPAITSGMPLPVEPTKPQEPPVPPPGSSQYLLDRYKTLKAQFDKDMLAYAAAMEIYQSDMQDYRDQNTYLDQFRLATAGSAYERHLKVYDAEGRLSVDQALKDNGAVRSLLVNEQFDAAGNVLRYRTESMVGEHVRNDYVNTYRTLTSATVQSSSTGHMTLLSGKMAGKTGSFATSTDVYDANGFLIGVNYSTDGKAPTSGTSRKAFIMDAAGHILLSREESHNSPTAEQYQIVANGELQLRFSMTYGSFGKLEKEQERAFWKAYNNDAYQSLVSPGGDLIVAPGANATTGQLVVAAQGDTLQSIAARVYGSPDAWYRLADANNLDFDSVLVAGQTVVAPAATASSNKLDFDLDKLVGSTAPNLPPPPPDKKNCITLIIVVVAVVVAAIVAPYALSAASSLVGGGATVATASTSGLMLAGAITGAVTNVASQAVAVAAGVQDKFDWRGVAMAAVGGAVGAGFNAVTSNSIVSSVATSVVTQGIEVMTGMQRKFSWAAVATAAVNAGVTSGIDNSGLGSGTARNTGTDQFSQGFFHGALSGLAGSLVTDLLVPGKQDWAQIAIGAVGGGLAGGLALLRPSDGDWGEEDLGNVPRDLELGENSEPLDDTQSQTFRIAPFDWEPLPVNIDELLSSTSKPLMVDGDFLSAEQMAANHLASSAESHAAMQQILRRRADKFEKDVGDNINKSLEKIPLPSPLLESSSSGNFGSFVELSKESRLATDTLRKHEIAVRNAAGPQLVPESATETVSYQRTRNRLVTTMLTGFPGAALPGAIATSIGQSDSQVQAANAVGGAIAGVELAFSGIPTRQPISVGSRSVRNVAADGLNINAHPQGMPYDGTVYRLESPARVSTTFDVHAGNVANDHRYSGPGVGSTYGATAADTALAEVEHYGLTAGRVFVSKSIRLQNVLDLTNPRTRQELNISVRQITGDGYLLTHQIGNFARQSGYDGILAPSARNPNGSNLIIFPRKTK